MNSLHGFVVWFDSEPASCFSDPLQIQSVGCEDMLLGTGFGIYNRTIAVGTCDAQRPLVDDFAVVAHRGWLGNREDLVRRLARPELAGATDAALLLSAYASWGVRFPASIEGEISFVILDRRSGKVLAARDALGLKKIYYFRQGRRTWITSVLPMLFAFLGYVPDLDVEQVARSIGKNFFPEDLTSTIYRGVKQSLPAFTLCFDGINEPCATRYWRPESVAEIACADDREYDERFRDVFARAVNGALPLAGPFSVELSGGLDSSSVAAVAGMAFKDATQRLTTVSYINPRGDIDEREYQRDLYTLHGLPNQTFGMDTRLRFTHFRGQFSLGMQTIQPLLSDDRLRLEGLGPVCLTGQGGDLVLANFSQPGFLADLFWSGQLKRWWRAMSSFASTVNAGIWPMLRTSLRRDFSLSQPLPYWLSKGRHTFVPEVERVFRLPARADIFSALTRLIPHAPDDARGIEYRHPILARSLVTFMLRLPWEQLVQPSRSRLIQRRAHRDILPVSIRERQSKGDFTMGAIHSYRSILTQHPGILAVPRLVEMGIVDGDKFSPALERALHGLADRDMNTLFAAVSYECWLQANDGVPAPPQLSGILATRFSRFTRSGDSRDMSVA